MSARYPAIAPKDLTREQQPIQDTLEEGIAQYFKYEPFTIRNSGGGLIGPFTQFLYLPKPIVDAYTAFAKPFGHVPELDSRCREIIILVAATHYETPYMKYAHVRVGKLVGLSEPQIKEILGGKAPAGVSEKELAAHDAAKALFAGRGPMSDELWARTGSAFGQRGAAALIQFTGFYAYCCILLNGANVPLPEGESIWPSEAVNGKVD